jgi:hypothetical protein
LNSLRPPVESLTFIYRTTKFPPEEDVALMAFESAARAASEAHRGGRGRRKFAQPTAYPAHEFPGRYIWPHQLFRIASINFIFDPRCCIDASVCPAKHHDSYIMAALHHKDMLNANKELLQSSKYSDLTIICGNREFNIHRSIVCPRSRFFAAACDGEFLVSLELVLD